MSAIIHKLNATSRSNNEEFNQLIEEITDSLNDGLSELMGSMFDGADDMLFQLAENADSNEDQNNYFDTMRMLRIERQRIIEHFAQHLQEFLKLDSQDDNDEFSLDDGELSLVDQNEMEEMVAVTAMHSKAMNIYGEAVNHLEARIEFMSMKSTVFDKDSLTPKNICEAFKLALSDIELSLNNKLLLYKLFDQEVLVNLAPLYKSLNQVFIDRGVLPKIKLGEQAPKQAVHNSPQQEPQVERNEAVYSENPTCDPSHSTRFSSHHFSQNPHAVGVSAGQQATSGVAPASGGVQQEVHRVVNQFLQGELTASGPGIPASFTTGKSAGSATPGQFYDRRDVVQALSNLQTSLLDQPAGQDTTIADFKQAILEDMSRRSGGAVTRRVSQVDEKTIDFIEMLFDAIVDDSSISEVVTNLLLRLQIPVIKVAMLDQEFFSDGDHPARTTLNLIAYLGRGITSKEDQLFISLESVVESLLDEFSLDIQSFEDTIERLQSIEDQEIELAAKKERQTQKDVLQKHAREIVLAELQYLVSNKILPKPCQKLLLKHWSTLMFHRYIKFGKNSDEWRDSIKTARQYISILQPVESTQAFHKLFSSWDEVLDSIQTTLLSTRQNPVEIETEVNHAFVTLNGIIENSEFNPKNMSEQETYFQPVDDSEEPLLDFDDLAMPDVELIDETSEPDPLEQQSQIAREKISRLPADARPGVWFEVYNGEDSAVRRAKLSVIIMEEARLVFVDRVGVKVIEKDADDFSNELAEGKSSIISDHSAFDHALGFVISSLSSAH